MPCKASSGQQAVARIWIIPVDQAIGNMKVRGRIIVDERIFTSTVRLLCVYNVLSELSRALGEVKGARWEIETCNALMFAPMY